MKYTDDSSFVIAGSRIQTVNDYFASLEQWLTSNGLNMNYNKTDLVIISLAEVPLELINFLIIFFRLYNRILNTRI